MKWPWQRAASSGTLVIGSHADTLAWAEADGPGALRRCGVETRGDDSAPDFARRLRGLGLPNAPVTVVLGLEEAQLLQIDTPAVKPEELKAAARWRIKDMIDAPLEELTIDVMHVRDDRPRANRQVFVAAARNALIRGIGERTSAAGLSLAVIDIAETTQRNLLTAAAQAAGLGDRATAALMRHGTQCLLTVCAGGELFYARRLEWDDNTLQARTNEPPPLALEAAMENLDFIDYGAGDGGSNTADDDAPRLVIELQRSFDVLERSWPELPLAGLWVQVGDGSAMLAELLHRALGMRVEVLDPESLFPGFDALSAAPGVRDAVLPLLGGLLRAGTRQL